MGLPAIGTVVLVNFPYADLRTFKKRPAIVVAHSSLNTVILCQITSRRLPNVPAIPLLTTDFATGNLMFTSYVRPDKLFTADPTFFNLTLGTLRSSKIKKILKNVQQLFDVPGGEDG